MTATILIVDDEDEIRKMMSRHFRLIGYTIESAENGVKALEILKSKHVDVVISDIKMPEMDGVELLRNIRTNYPMIRPIMLTGYVTLTNILDCWRYGADRCFFKPLEDMEELDKVVAQSIERTQSWNQILQAIRHSHPTGN